jgi:nicotinate (nicotinamide) nucleotide adenylyltransferase
MLFQCIRNASAASGLPACNTTVVVALSFQYRAVGRPPGRVALFPGAWNPPTVAHIAIARAAITWSEEVVWLLPRAFPHKSFDGAPFEDRLLMLRRITAESPQFSVAIADGGLYVEMAGEAREFFGPAPEIALLCGRDAAERIAAWDYGRPGVFDRMLERYPLLVAGRDGDYLPASHHADRVIQLPMEASFEEVSSTEVRDRIRRGADWRHLVPASIAETAASLYSLP